MIALPPKLPVEKSSGCSGTNSVLIDFRITVSKEYRSVDCRFPFQESKNLIYTPLLPDKQVMSEIAEVSHHGDTEGFLPRAEPSAWGFRNIRPKPRSERRSAKNKVELERSRLMARSGWQARLHQKNCPETTFGLTSCRPGDEGYMSDNDRFHSDVAGEEYEMRLKAHERSQQAEVFRRERARRRDEDRWAKNEKIQNHEEEQLQKIRENPHLPGRRTGKKNMSNVSYDITNLQYNQDTSGEAQQYYDNMVRYRAQNRTRALVVLGDSRVPYNILNGEERTLPEKPKSVQRPDCVDNPEMMVGHTSVDKRKVSGPGGDMEILKAGLY